MADPLHQFVIKPIIPLEAGGVDLSFTNSSLWMAIAAGLSAILLSAAMRRKSIVPGKMQMIAELTYQFVGDMIRENLGTRGREYFPLVFTVFIVVLMGNSLGMLPYSFTFTSHIIVTGALALFIFLMIIAIGLLRHGLHFLELFVPPGISPWLLPLIVPIEIISFLARPITLAVRLFANMMAGHLVLKVFAGFSVSMLSLGAAGFFVGFIPALFNTALIAFEFLIAYLQAYVFAILTCIYLKDTIEIDH